jgi:hypothetical protein
MTWIPLTDGQPVPNDSEVRPDGAGGWEYQPAPIADERPCADPIARFKNGELTWECRTLTCTTECYDEKTFPDPTQPETFRIACKCAEV